jgi:hypothetical protein
VIYDPSGKGHSTFRSVMYLGTFRILCRYLPALASIVPSPLGPWHPAVRIGIRREASMEMKLEIVDNEMFGEDILCDSRQCKIIAKRFWELASAMAEKL